MHNGTLCHFSPSNESLSGELPPHLMKNLSGLRSVGESCWFSEICKVLSALVAAAIPICSCGSSDNVTGSRIFWSIGGNNMLLKTANRDKELERDGSPPRL